MTSVGAVATVPIYARIFRLDQDNVFRKRMENLGDSEAWVGISSQEVGSGRACDIYVEQQAKPDQNQALHAMFLENFYISPDRAQPYLNALNIGKDYCNAAPIKLSVNRLVERQSIEVRYVSGGTGAYTYNAETGRGICVPVLKNQSLK